MENDRPMTVDDWALLYALADKALDHSNSLELSCDLLAVRDKCRVRALALKEGRVVP